jgi:transposase-like protein
MAGTKRIVQRYECSACGYGWSEDRKCPMGVAFPQPSCIIVVPRHLSDACECDESASNDGGGRQSAFGEVE